MQATEALQRLIAIADARAIRPIEDLEEGGPERDEVERDQLAIAVGQAMLNVMIPVARFRAFIEVDEVQPKRSKQEEERAVHTEFTVCSVDMAGIISGLIGVTSVNTNTRITVWEQRAHGADMISGYQGETKCLNYRLWVKGLVELETRPTVQ